MHKNSDYSVAMSTRWATWFVTFGESSEGLMRVYERSGVPPNPFSR